jgi:serine protease Do
MIHSPAARSNKFLTFSTVYLLAATLVLGVAVAGTAKAKDASTVPALKRVEAKSQAVAAKVLAATVGIINQGLAGGGHMGEGSGVCVSEDGIILTAGHVMGAVGAELTVIFPDGRRCNAKALGANFSRDSGVIKILDPGKYPYVEMGHSDELKPGAWCMALGHPGGVQQGRTPPIRLGRLLAAGKGARFIVSDATVISGDSGGPLFDLEGRVIGIHSNIGMNVNQNQHVPIDVYHGQWKDLLASKSFGSPRDMPTANNMPDPAKLQKFRELFFKKMMAGDPEVKDLAKDGQLRLSPDDIERLLAKWEKEEAAAAAKKSAAATVTTSGTAGANDAIDFLKFQRLFQERLLAGDPETLKLVKDGKMMVTPQQMHQLMDLWEGKTLAGGAKPKSGETAATAPKEKPASEKPASDKSASDKTASSKPATDKGPADKTASSKPSSDKSAADKGATDKSDKSASGKVAGPDKSPAPTPTPTPRRQRREPTPEKAKPEDLAKLRDLMKNAVPLGDGRYGFRGSPDAARDLRATPGWGSVSQAMSFGKSSPQILQEVAPIANKAGQSTVIVLCDGKPAVLGTIVRKDGLILTKFSELHGKITCKIGTSELPATVVKKRNEHDLALLKVDAKDLTPIVWAEGDAPVPGSWLITPSADNDALGMGVVSIATRSIADAPSMVMKNRAMVGVLLDQQAKNALVQSVSPGLPAALGGLKAGDVIEKINDEVTKLPKDVTQLLTKYKPGDRISVEVTRNGKPVKLSMNLVSSDRLAPKTNGENLTRLSEAGGTVSKRHGSFVSAFTHDTVIQSTDCGGPVVNLDGKAVGLNIARVDRTATYAIPASMLRLLMPEMLPK